MKTKLFLFIILNITLSSFSQNDLRKGYIITNSLDTLFGSINFQGDIKNGKECVFFFESGENKVFHPFEIYGYRFDGGKYYVSRIVKEDESTDRIFAEYLVRGKKDLLYFRDFRGPHYLLSMYDSTLIKIPYNNEFFVEGKLFLHESTRHIGFLKVYFADCPSVFNEIEKMGMPDTKKLISITKKYHDEVCGENSCIIYKKNKLPVKIAIEPKLEITSFRGDPGYFKQYGGLLYLWLPESNEKLYLKTGFMVSKYNTIESYNTIERTLYKIPLHFEYIFTKKIISPKLDIGVNLYGFRYPGHKYGTDVLTFAVAGGLLVRTTRFLSWM